MVSSMFTEQLTSLIFITVLIALLHLLLMAFEANNETIIQVWGVVLGMVILIQLTL
jgi:hypothetical protein